MRKLFANCREVESCAQSQRWQDILRTTRWVSAAGIASGARERKHCIPPTPQLLLSHLHLFFLCYTLQIYRFSHQSQYYMKGILHCCFCIGNSHDLSVSLLEKRWYVISKRGTVWAWACIWIAIYYLSQYSYSYMIMRSHQCMMENSHKGHLSLMQAFGPAQVSWRLYLNYRSFIWEMWACCLPRQYIQYMATTRLSTQAASTDGDECDPVFWHWGAASWEQTQESSAYIAKGSGEILHTQVELAVQSVLVHLQRNCWDDHKQAIWLSWHSDCLINECLK